MPRRTQIKIAVGQLNPDNLGDLTVLENALCLEANLHGCRMDSGSIDAVADCIGSGHATADILILKDNNGVTSFAGNTVHYASVFPLWNGSAFTYYPAEYYEDFIVTEALHHKIISQSPSVCTIGNRGLGKHFQLLSLRVNEASLQGKSTYHPAPRAIIAEYTEHNIPAARQLRHFGGEITTHDESGIFSIAALTPVTGCEKDAAYFLEAFGGRILRERNNLIGLKSSSTYNEYANTFALSAEGTNPNEKLAVTFTRGLSTFTGKTVCRAQVATAPDFRDQQKIKGYLSTIFNLVQKEVMDRGWYNSDVSEHAENTVLNNTYVHVYQNRAVVETLRHMGAKDRKLGNNLMLPCLADFKNADIPELSEKDYSSLSTMRHIIPQHKVLNKPCGAI